MRESSLVQMHGMLHSVSKDIYIHSYKLRKIRRKWGLSQRQNCRSLWLVFCQLFFSFCTGALDSAGHHQGPSGLSQSLINQWELHYVLIWQCNWKSWLLASAKTTLYPQTTGIQYDGFSESDNRIGLFPCPWAPTV